MRHDNNISLQPATSNEQHSGPKQVAGMCNADAQQYFEPLTWNRTLWAYTTLNKANKCPFKM